MAPVSAEVLDTVIKETKAEKVHASSATPSQQVKNKSSGKASSQRKKKRQLSFSWLWIVSLSLFVSLCI